MYPLRKGRVVVYVYAVMLTLVNVGLWFSILFNVPGTWLMILFPAILEWWKPGQFMYSWTLLFVAAGLAILGEVLEFVLGAAKSRQAGGSKRAAALAIVGSIVGGILGTALPIPLLGTLIGACLGAFGGSIIGELWMGRPLVRSVAVGRSAAVGRFWGSIAKLSVGAVIVVVLAFGAFL